MRGEAHVPWKLISLLLKGEVTPATPIRVTHAMGGKPADIVWTTAGSPIIVSEHVLDFLSTAEVTGWKPYPVDLIDKRGHQIDGYFWLAITGRCGPEDRSRVELVLAEFPTGTYPTWRGWFFEPDSWDGSDFFTPSDDTLFVMVTDRVKKLFRERRIANIRFEPLASIERIPDSVGNG